MSDVIGVQRRPSLVLADDEPMILGALKELLEEAGYSVLGTAATGPDAVEVVELLQPDILLVDFRMPGLTGLEVAALMRERMPQLSVIVFSAYDDTSLQLEAEQIPVAAYLVKGCASRAIFKAIEEAKPSYPTPLGIVADG